MKAAVKCCLAGPRILQQGVTSTATGAWNTSAQWHAGTATQKHPSCSTTSLCTTLSIQITTTFPDVSPQIHRHSQEMGEGLKTRFQCIWETMAWISHYSDMCTLHQLDISTQNMANKVTFLLLLLEKLHMHCLSVGIGRQLPGCGVKPHLQICIQIHQPQEAFLFYTPLICVITLTKLTQHPKVVCKNASGMKSIPNTIKKN